MDLRAYIARAEKITQSSQSLAELIGVRPQELSSAKKGARGLPTVACGKLADLIGESHWTVQCASEVLTEKDEEKRNYLLDFVMGTTRKHATLKTRI